MLSLESSLVSRRADTFEWSGRLINTSKGSIIQVPNAMALILLVNLLTFVRYNIN